jgi:hypothetical protein
MSPSDIPSLQVILHYCHYYIDRKFCSPNFLDDPEREVLEDVEEAVGNMEGLPEREEDQQAAIFDTILSITASSGDLRGRTARSQGVHGGPHGTFRGLKAS